MSKRNQIIWDTPNKDVPRQIVMQKRGRPARRAMTMPAGKMLCTKAGKASGLFNEHTEHWFIEKDPYCRRQIIKEIDKSGCEWYANIWPDESSKMDITAEVGKEKLFDFVYLDYCTAIQCKEAYWLHTQLANALAHNSKFTLTANRARRNSGVMRWWVEEACMYNEEAKKLRLRAGAMLDKASCVGKVGDVTSYLDDSHVSFEDNIMIPGRSTRGWNKVLIPTYTNATLDIASLMLLIFCNHNFDFAACVEYSKLPGRSSSPMTTVSLRGMTRRKRSRVSREFYGEFLANINPGKSIKIGVNSQC